MQDSRSPAKTLAAVVALASAMPAQAAVNDIFPGDFAALPEGAHAATLYYFHREFEGWHAKGEKRAPGTVRSDVAALRWVRYGRLGGFKVAPVAVVSASDTRVAEGPLRTALGTGAQGFGDLRLGASLWLIERPESGDFLGVTALLMPPTGTYRSGQALNIGENRWKATLNLGWVGKPAAKWTFDISPEIAWYGSNDDYVGERHLEQRPSWALTAYLRHHPRPGLQLFAGAQANGGGETRIDGIPQDNAAGNMRQYLGLAWVPAPSNQLALRYGRDSAIRNGLLNQHEVTLRLVRVF